jgi:hypothetical protein
MHTRAALHMSYGKIYEMEIMQLISHELLQLSIIRVLGTNVCGHEVFEPSGILLE